MKLRSFNPALASHFMNLPRSTHQYGLKNINTAETCQQVLDALQLTKKYPHSAGKLDIVDVFSGYGLFSTMLNYELKPRNHVIIDNTKDNVKVWEHRIAHLESTTGNKEGFRYFDLDGFSWDSYDKIIKEQKCISPSVQPRSQIHDELLIVGNLTSIKTGESLFAQWIQCCAYQNWLQKYGRVRMVLFVREATTSKFLSDANFNRRNRAALKRDVFTESKLIAVSDAQPDSVGTAGELYDPNVLVRDQPVVLPITSILPIGGDLSVVEIVPRADFSSLDINAIDYICQIVMYRSNGTVRDSLSIIAPGAAEDLGPKIPDSILNKTARQLTREDIIKLHDVYVNWAFKPSYEDTLSFFTDETRNF